MGGAQAVAGWKVRGVSGAAVIAGVVASTEGPRNMEHSCMRWTESTRERWTTSGGGARVGHGEGT